MNTMNAQELNDFKDRLAYLAASGTEAEVRAHISQNFQRLPEELQHEITFNLFYSSVADSNREQEAIGDVQEEGLAAAEALQDAKKEIENGGTAQS
jgi:hypothetical protein